MNYLAHLYFAEPTPESMAANLMGDFVKGRLAPDWHPELREGVMLHRRIDGFTDSHPVFLRSAARLSRQRRRFAGIIIDIAYDHFLCRHWQHFHDVSRQQYIACCYTLLGRYQGFMPDPMRRLLDRLIPQDWLNAYAEREQISYVLDRVAHRLSRPELMLGAGEEFEACYAELEEDFLVFFPALIEFAEQQRQSSKHL